MDIGKKLKEVFATDAVPSGFIVEAESEAIGKQVLHKVDHFLLPSGSHELNCQTSLIIEISPIV